MDSNVVVSTPYDNARSFIALCNETLQENAVVDSKGNPAFFASTIASPAWLFALAHGTLETVWQNKLRDGVNSFSVENCSDAQVLNLAQLAGITRETGRPTSVEVTIRSKDTASCTVTEGDVYTALDKRWVALSSATISASSSTNIYFVCEENGAVPMSALQPFVPVEDNAGLLSALSTANSIQGTGYESITSLRQRILNQDASLNNLDSCAKKIETLVGIMFCSIYFNDSITETMTLPGGVTLAPRTALITVFGTDADDLIGATFYSYMAVPTKEGTYESVYRTYSGQLITVNYEKATIATIQVRVIVSAGTAPEGYVSFLKEAIISASGTLKVGSNYSSQYLSSRFLSDFPYATVLGVEVWNGSAWDVETALSWNAVGVFTEASISIVEQ